FDFVVMNFVICTIPEIKEIEQIFREVSRLLKPGGQLFVLNVNWEKCNGREFLSFKLDHVDDLKPGDKVASILKWDDNIRVRDYFWPQSKYRHFFEQAGFKDVRIKEILASNEPYPWVDEAKYSPFFIVSGQK
ncbi:MAG: methyltransferase domain-containing protein, partial [Candidatus Vogelbacteria bacterium]|nr:methyltransferase domain-containing protein [Candidatus Vogelbacteria bacterium]